MAKGVWLNTKTVLFKPSLGYPCGDLGYCPYGEMVEEFPAKKSSKLACHIFNHDCPVFYHAELGKAEGHRLVKRKEGANLQLLCPKCHRGKTKAEQTAAE